MNALTAQLGLPPLTLLAIAMMVLAAAAIRGLTGFGMAIILVPLLGLIIPPGEAVVLAIFLQLLIGPVGLRAILANADRQSALTIAVVAMGATPLGILLLKIIVPDTARLLIAGIAIAAFILVLLPPHKDGRVPGRLATWGTGVAAGLLTGFAAMPGPPVVPYYMRQNLPPATARASMLLVFFGTAIAGSAASIALGVGSWKTALLALILFVPMLVGNWLGGLAFGRIAPPIWRAVVAVILGVAGVSAVLRAF